MILLFTKVVALWFYRQEALLSDEQAQEIVAMLSPRALEPDNGVSLNDSYQSVLSYERYIHTYLLLIYLPLYDDVSHPCS